MTTEAESNRFEFKQKIIEFLWNDDSPQAADKAVAQCSSDEEREHALWMAVALQRGAAVNALLHAGVGAEAREAALALLCGGLARIGTRKIERRVTQHGSVMVDVFETAVRAGTSPFWFEAQKLMNIYLQQGRIKQSWLGMLPALREGVEPSSLTRYIQTLRQASSREIDAAVALLQSGIDRQAQHDGTHAL